MKEKIKKEFKLLNILKSENYIVCEFPGIKIKNIFTNYSILSFFGKTQFDYNLKNLAAEITFSESSKKSENMGHFLGDIKNTTNLKNLSNIFLNEPII